MIWLHSCGDSIGARLRAYFGSLGADGELSINHWTFTGVCDSCPFRLQRQRFGLAGSTPDCDPCHLVRQSGHHTSLGG
jgi:hypothetical protein